MKETLYQKLVKYNRSNIYPFCAPGHKRSFCAPDVDNPYEIDIKGGADFDFLQEPSGILKEMQQRLADVYGVPHVFLSVGGAAAGMLAALCTIPKGAAVCVARNCHKAVFDALSVGGRKAYYTYPEELLADSMIFGGVSCEAVEQLLKKHSDIKAVIVTSPTPEGYLSDIKALAEAAHRYGARLIVDESHGAHLPYHEAFPVSAMYLGADIVVQELEETLPTLTQTALVIVNEDEETARKVARALCVFTPQSPSYGLLASIEYGVEWCVENEEEFNSFVKNLAEFKKRSESLQTVRLLGQEQVATHHIFDWDSSKVTIVSPNLSPNDLATYFLQEHKLQMEAVGAKHVSALTSVMDTQEAFHKLSHALEGVQKAKPYPKAAPLSKEQMKQISLLYLSKVGRVYDDFIYVFPPACPIIAPGEVFTKELCERILQYIEQGLTVTKWERSIF